MSGLQTCSGTRAGLLRLPVSINQQFFNRDLARTAIKKHETYLQENQDRPHRFAIRNFLAVFHFRLGNIFKACEYFEETLWEDETNINAISDLAYVNEKLYQHSFAEELTEKLNSLMELQDDANNSQKEIMLKRRSRCIAEKGYIFANDLIRDTVSIDKQTAASEMYSEAIRLSEGIVGKEELQDWKFYRGLLYKEMYNIHLDFYVYNSATTDELYKTSEDGFKYNMSATNKHRKADAYSLLGSLMAKRCSRGKCQPKKEGGQFKKNECHCRTEANEFIKRALHNDPTNIRIYVRYGRELAHSKDFEGALIKFNQAIMLDESSTNWFAYSSRANWYIDKYIRSKPESKDRGYLLLAEADLLKSIMGNPSPIDLGKLGHVYYLLGLTAKTRATDSDGARCRSNDANVKDDKYYFLKALHYFMNATETGDGNQRHDIHFKRGQCLLDMNELRGAVESFKKALECERPNCKTVKNVENLILSLFDLYEKVEQDNQKEILAELCFWWCLGFKNKSVESFVNKKKNVKKMLRLLEALLKNHEADQDKVVTDLAGILNKNEHKKEKVKTLLSKYTHGEVFNKNSATFKSKTISEKTPREEGDAIPHRDNKTRSRSVQICQEHTSFAKRTIESRSDHDQLTVGLPVVDVSANIPVIVAATSAAELDGAAVVNAPITTAPATTAAATNDATVAVVDDTNVAVITASSPPATVGRTFVNNTSFVGSTNSTFEYGITASTATTNNITVNTTTTTTTTTTNKETLKRSETHTLLKIDSEGICITPVRVHPSERTTEQKQCSIADVVQYICKQLDVHDSSKQSKTARPTVPHPPSKSKSGLDYDFFVVFSGKQKDWVYYTLLSRLEQTYRFKGCIPDRDFALGATVCQNIEKSVEKSACTLVVIDEEFCEDHALCHRLSYAYLTNVRVKRLLIPIVKEHPRNIPMEICNLTPLIATKTINLSKLAKDIEIAILEDTVCPV
ncbi:uncharacterized protein LOC117117716 [Anneissia japonica]|uniref:uncharacterized protein LOC117117716 n=1 Tax=Anneissia japonica TaxID=1529436 RepID=UPI00142565D5|nr:uncharacterized protein LOC117117716 [Anneissia japonica]